MKKFAQLILILSLCSMLCACGVTIVAPPPESEPPAATESVRPDGGSQTNTPAPTPTPTVTPAPTPTPELPAPVISAYDYTAPGEIVEGTGFTLAGTVSAAPGSITSVTACIKNSYGGVEQTKTYPGEGSNFSLASFDYDLFFGQLAPGGYYYIVSVTAANGNKIVTSEPVYVPFTVKERPQISVDSYFEGKYVYRMGFYRMGFCNGGDLDPTSVFGSMFFMDESMHSIYLSDNRFSGYLGSCGLSGTYACTPASDLYSYEPSEAYINIESFTQDDEDDEMNRMRILDMHTESATIDSGVFGLIFTLYDPYSGNTYEIWFNHAF